MRLPTLALPALTAILAALAPANAAPPATLFEHARIVAMDGAPPIDDGAILVENGTIVRVGRAGSIAAPARVARVDLSGKTIIPGLVVLHAHVGYLKGTTFDAANYTRETIVDQLNRYLYYGIVAVMSTGTDPGDLPYRLRNEPHPGALFRTAGRGLAAPDASTGNAAMRSVPYGVTTEEEARRDVRALAAKRPDFIKIWVDDRNGTVRKLSPPLYRAIIDEAHARRIRVMAHVYYLADAHDLVDAGVDGFLHLVRDAEMDDALVQKMAARRVFVTPNLGVGEAASHAGRPGWLDDPALAETAAPDALAKVGAFYGSRTASTEAAARSYAFQQRSLAKLNHAGVPIALGNDSGIENTFFGYSEHRELQLMAAAGMTPMQVLAAATRTPASILRLDRLGTLASNKSADFVVLDRNPLDDIGNTRAIFKVYQRGVEVDRAALRAAWRAAR